MHNWEMNEWTKKWWNEWIDRCVYKSLKMNKLPFIQWFKNLTFHWHGDEFMNSPLQKSMDGLQEEISEDMYEWIIELWLDGWMNKQMEKNNW